MISGKNQIVRQKNIDSHSNLIEPKIENFSLSTSREEISSELNTDVNDELEQINQSLAKLTYKLNTEEDEFERFTFNPTNTNFDLTPSSSSSSSSPSNLLNSCSSNDKSPKSLNNVSTTSSTTPSVIVSNQTSVNVSSSSINHNLIHSSSHKISTNLREKFSKAKANSNPVKTTNSVPITQPKQRRLANLMRLSQASSFFSRSCPGEEMAQLSQNELNTSDENHLNNSTDNNHAKTNISASTTNTTSTTTSHQKFLGKSFLSSFGSKNKTKKSNELNTYSSTSPLTSSANSVYSSLNIDSNPSHHNLLFSPKQQQQHQHHNVGTIGSYQVDLEKLARELILPSMDAPLTSYKSSLNTNLNTNTNTNKPPLLPSKTIDLDKNNKRKMMTRSLTQNK